MSNLDINWGKAFIANLLIDQKVFQRENRIKLRGKVFHNLESVQGGVGPLVFPQVSPIRRLDAPI